MHLPIDAYSTLHTVPEMKFAHELLNHRVRGDGELDDHLQLLLTYAMSRGQDKEKMSGAKYHLWRHIQEVKHHFALMVDEADMERFVEWADEANAIYLASDGSIRDSYARVLIGKDGRSDPDAKIPYPPDARARKARTEAALERRGIAVPSHLPPVICEAEVEMRSTEETAKRALALFLVARRAEFIYDSDPISVVDLESRSPIAFKSLSPSEREFVTEASPAPLDVLRFLWRFEALYLLLWAIGGAVELPFPSEVHNLPGLKEFMARVSEEEFLAHASLRPTGAILDALDLHFRCHWAIRQARIRGELNEEEPFRDIVPQRHHALNWLVRFENADWDDTDTPT